MDYTSCYSFVADALVVVSIVNMSMQRAVEAY